MTAARAYQILNNPGFIPLVSAFVWPVVLFVVEWRRYLAERRRSRKVGR